MSASSSSPITPGLAPLTGEASFKWPANLAELGLNENDKNNLELMIRIWLKKFPPEGIVGHDIYAKVDRNKLFVCFADGQELSSCRTILHMVDRVIVNLKKTVKVGADQRVIKLAYDPLNGQLLLKKRIVSPLMDFLSNALVNKFVSQVGLSEIVAYASKNTYEIYYPKTLSQAEAEIDISIRAIKQLQDGLKLIHSHALRPKTYEIPGGFTISNKPVRKAYHGNICFENIVCDFRNSKGNGELRWIDFDAGLRLDRVVCTPGWGSPEMYRMKRDEDFSPKKFNLKYGQKKDVWAFGLVVGSLLKGTSSDAFTRSLPPFDFISDKIKLNGHKIDDSEIGSLTQEEVDKELDSICNALDPVADRILLQMWEKVRLWLRVDPDERPLLDTAYMSSN